METPKFKTRPSDIWILEQSRMTMNAKFLEPVSGRDLDSYVARFKVSNIEKLDRYMEALYWSLTLMKNSEARATMAKMKNILAVLTANLQANATLNAHITQNLATHAITAQRELGLLAYFCEWLEIRMDKCFETICQLAAIVLQWLTFFLLVFGFMSIDNKRFFRIFNGVRYKCTTMPWTIWPALVVLWGVCWMFYGFPVDGYGGLDVDDTTSLWLSGSEGVDNQNPWPGVADANLPEFDFLLTEQYHYGSDQMLQDANVQTSDLGQPGLSATSTVTVPVYATSHVEHGWPLADLSTTNPTRNFDLDYPSSEIPQAPAIMNGVTNQIRTAIAAARDSQSQESTTQTHNSRRRRTVSCEICNMTFHRTDVLKRHRHEKHETDELLCPHNPCKRSEQGSGFKRQEHLKRHLISCKVLKNKATPPTSLTESEHIQLGTQVGPVDERPMTLQLSQEGPANMVEGTSTAGIPGNCNLLDELKKRRGAEYAELKRLDQEREEKKQAIASFNQCIKILEGQSSSTKGNLPRS